MSLSRLPQAGIADAGKDALLSLSRTEGAENRKENGSYKQVDRFFDAIFQTLFTEKD